MPDDTGQDRVLAVVIPAYNEQATIETVLRKVDALPFVREIIVVDDGSVDGTADRVRAVDSPRVRLLRQERNQGKTAAVRRGVREATSPLIVIQDADLEYDPAEIPFVIAPIQTGQADVVYGSRFLVRRTTRVLYFYHFLANKFLTLCCNLLTNLNMTDIETCYKAFRTPVLQQIPLRSRGFGMEVEITAVLGRTACRVYEVPISYYGRTYAEGKKIGPIDGVHALWCILYYNLAARFSRPYRGCVKAIDQWLNRNRRTTDIP
ncbi:MAG TPA: glycosyltransferase family 2 protein [Phycisphaerae bacterium]|nr:glycosyltransferase family 2 protein [Phycisphaerae bacterium]